MRLPTKLDRYPAKMVSRLADHLVDRYALGARRVLDPFCGSGAVLVAAQRRGIPVSGMDLNPVSGLFCNVKLHGFDGLKAQILAGDWIAAARKATRTLPVGWDAKGYWFTPGTLDKFERLRFAATTVTLTDTPEGNAVLLSYALSIRLCSRADQRSPKPFISVQARQTRSGKHFDPYSVVQEMLRALTPLYSACRSGTSTFRLVDVAQTAPARRTVACSHIVTSPPYINAQDYFRNFKLELYLLEGILPFQVATLRHRFIGTERGALLEGLRQQDIRKHCELIPKLKALQASDARLAAVVHRYVHDMGTVFDGFVKCLEPSGCCVIVCGDNLVGGIRIPTWRVLERLLTERGFVLFDRFRDSIQDRLLAPKRCGHKGLIKEEVVSAFRAPAMNSANNVDRCPAVTFGRACRA